MFVKELTRKIRYLHIGHLRFNKQFRELAAHGTLGGLNGVLVKHLDEFFVRRHTCPSLFQKHFRVLGDILYIYMRRKTANAQTMF